MSKLAFFSGMVVMALGLSAFNTGAFAQGRANNGFGNNNNRNQNGGGAALPLPDGVKSVVSIDAYNILLAQVERDGQQDLAPIIIRHVYSGGIAKLFGGGSIPTEQFVTPGTLGGGNRGGGTGANGGGFGGGGFGGQAANTGGGFNAGGFGNTTGNTGNFGGNFGNGNFGAFQIRPMRRN